MSYGIFIDRMSKPSEEQIVKILGNKFKQWNEINSIEIIKTRIDIKLK